MLRPVTKRERVRAVLRGEVPDCVPCCPDISNMVPCRLTGKPFWHVYALRDPPLWKAHIDAIKRFDLDGGFEVYDFDSEVLPYPAGGSRREARVVRRNPDGGFVARVFDAATGEWDPCVTVYTADNPPATHVRPASLGLPDPPSEWNRCPPRSAGLAGWSSGA
jgi:hypothetical protein